MTVTHFNHIIAYFRMRLNGVCQLFFQNRCISHPIRWIHFLLDDKIQKHLRELSFELINFLNSSLVIYVPDNAVKESDIIDFIWDDENRDIEYIQKWLLTECGSTKE
ncbi:hypothetical protein DRW41_16920 [Neobacillus piezotolerans]|uniref:Uncharacterized protein n=1 Tax=Neobacillus piezotolerans TaxID=2259171 RepID=A0A3D8GMU3_9BACI|nr:hypothetical protein DRW41_16920 [Neobacillus piezotolerans]